MHQVSTPMQGGNNKQHQVQGTTYLCQEVVSQQLRSRVHDVAVAGCHDVVRLLCAARVLKVRQLHSGITHSSMSTSATSVPGYMCCGLAATLVCVLTTRCLACGCGILCAFSVRLVRPLFGSQDVWCFQQLFLKESPLPFMCDMTIVRQDYSGKEV